MAGDDTGQIELRRMDRAHMPGTSTPTLNLSKQQWHSDLLYYATELPKRHIDAFHHVSRDQFASEVSALDQRIDRLDGDEVFVGLVRLAALVGDEHTHFEPSEDVANFPIDIRRFGDAYRVVAVVDPRNARALGARIVRVGQTPFSKARLLLLALTAQDENPNHGLARIEQTMTQEVYLHGLGLIPSNNRAITLFDEDGEELIWRWFLDVVNDDFIPPNGRCDITISVDQ